MAQWTAILESATVRQGSKVTCVNVLPAVPMDALAMASATVMARALVMLNGLEVQTALVSSFL